MNLLSRLKYPILIVVILLLALHPLSFFHHIPKWDSVRGYLPYRYFIGDYVWHGHMPYWNPFQRLGFPGYADLQSGCWYPVVWFLLLFGKYTITSLIVEVLLCFVIAGWGMYQLSSYIHKDRRTALIIALSYALSGFMVGSTQLMVFLIGVAWLPWCIWALLRLMHTRKYKYALYSALFIAMNITGASPAFTIVLGYITIGIFVFFLVKERKSWDAVKRIILSGVIILGTLAVLLMPFLYSFLEFSPYFNRVSKLTYDIMIMNSYGPNNFISFLFPYTVIAKSECFLLTDMTLRNIYVGLIGFGAFVVGIIQHEKTSKYFLPLIFALVGSLMLALGGEFFIYKYVIHLPGFGVFKHPSFFRAYAILCVLLIAGFPIAKALREMDSTKIIRWVGLGIVACSVIGMSVGFVLSSPKDIAENLHQLAISLEFPNSEWPSHLFINSVIVLLILGLVVLSNRLLKLSLFTSLVLFLAIDLIVQTRLTAPSTIHHSVTYKAVNDYFHSLPDEHNQSFNYTPLKEMDETRHVSITECLPTNVSTFNKTLSFVGENPMRFSSFDKAKENGVLDRNIENNILFFPDKKFTGVEAMGPGYIWDVTDDHLSDEDHLIPDSTKSKEINPEVAFVVNSIHIGYNEFDAEVQNWSNHPRWLLLNQNYHHLWKASLNGADLPVKRANEMIMGVEIPPNCAGSIVFQYVSPGLIYLAVGSMISYLLIGVIALRALFKSSHP